MWRRRSWRFYFGFPPFGFYFHGIRPFPSKEEYLGMLEDYKRELEEVEKEIEEIRKSP
jgi:hypothetical protein